ncbi:2'-deoxycytidine 5'-triphosphate deaminase domain-containing protein [Terricaulis silvestris]|uniref:Deoxycytidine triphosphate deaminase n=1 Tax=Terricaulis silvestris TaxID=2686094 RepID=A0A6I6MRQ7_9CAUL|nr:2'-deoxycytidine 5'-triphosphate deaminase [Terricaulis silvestris]QGZ96106.1 Deoxycytidine triphosphate deaminase [Terricaulis silvestris]
MTTHGVLSDSELKRAIKQGWIVADTPFIDDQIQPASLDLRLGETAYRLRASFLPGAGAKVQDRLDDQLVMHKIDLRAGAVLETGCVYLVQVQEELALPQHIAGAANPKSSTGRVDVFTRLILDGASSFDHVPAGYRGPMWAEISPCTFSVLVRTGTRLSQVRLRRGPQHPKREIDFTMDLAMTGPVGFRAKRHSGVIDLDRVGAYDPRDFWEPMEARKGRVVLDPGQFYIFASKENVVIPPDEAAEMAPIRPELGEFRAHYAGFFDPGFGIAPNEGRAVLEVRSRDVPFFVEDGQPVGKLVFEPLCGPVERLYGESGSNYQGQGLKLSKNFAPWR